LAPQEYLAAEAVGYPPPFSPVLTRSSCASDVIYLFNEQHFLCGGQKKNQETVEN
jgi:hypothetical protein